jgi:hypothetical protein
LPKQELAIFIVFNSVEAGSLRPVITYPVIDRLLGLDYTPWGQRYRQSYVYEKARGKKIVDSVRAARIKNTSPSHPLTAYKGTYINNIYGNIDIELVNNELVMIFRRQRSVLKHFHYDQFITDEKDSDAPDFRLQFDVSDAGAIDRISMRPFGDPQTEFVKKQ